jgi:hypothetical protein
MISDDTADVPTGNERKIILLDVAKPSLTQLPVNVVYARKADPHEQLSVRRDGSRQVDESQSINAAKTEIDDCPHVRA